MAKSKQNEIIWAEPPAVTRGPQANPRYSEFANALRANPGVWAVFKENAKDSQNVTDINKGYMQAFTPAGDFQATGRRTDDDPETGAPRFTIYARYIGPGFEGDPEPDEA